MNYSITRTWIAAAFGLALLQPTVVAQTLFQDSFNSESAGDYQVFEFVPERDGAVFGFNYGELGIPAAPNSSDGSAVGLKLFSNDPAPDTAAARGGVQVVPVGVATILDAHDDYAFTYDLWMNVNGPLPLGGDGATEAMMVGVGFSGTEAIQAGTIDGTYFTMTGDGGAFDDLRSFTNDGDGFNAPGINVGPVAAEGQYYAEIFPGGVDVGALPVQGGQDRQVGITQQGQMAFQWHEVRVQVTGRQVEFFIDDLIIAHDDRADVNGNMVLGHFDYFSSENDAPQWNFSLIDNLRVFTSLTSAGGDFNGDEAISVDDIDSLCGAIAAGSTDVFFDLTGDGEVNRDDLNEFLAITGNLSGDADLDGTVAFADFLTLGGNFGQAANWSGGDFDCSGDVGFADFLALGATFGQSVEATAAAVPEPGSSLLALTTAVSLFVSLRRSRRAA